MIVFEKIRYKNLLSVGNQFIEIDLRKSPTTLIVGKNGSAKSTLVEAFSFGLFGKPYRDINKPQLVNSINERDLLTEIEFSIGKQKFLIRRGMKPSIFEIYQNNKILDQVSKNLDYQTHLEDNILKINHKSFFQMVVIGTKNYVPFMRLNAALRRDFVENLIDLKIFSDMGTLAKIDLNEDESKYRELNQQKLVASKKIESYEDTLLKIQNENNNVIESEEKIIVDYVMQKEKIQNDISIKKEKLDDLITKEQQMKFDSSDLITMNSLLKTTENKIISIQNKNKFYQEHENCPTCKQEINAHFKTNIFIKIDNNKKNLEKVKKDIENNIKLEIVARDDNRKIINEIEIIKNDMKNFVYDIKILNSKITMGKENIEKIKKQKTVTDIKEFIKEHKKVIKQLSKTCEEHEKQIVMIKNIIAIMKDDGIKTHIIKQFIPLINKRINMYLNKMGFPIHFELNESFKETIFSLNRNEFSYGSFSDGERLRIDWAILFTWRHLAKIKNHVSSNLLIIDEALDSSLDSSGVENLIDVLLNVEKTTNSFIISHRENVIEKFPNIIKFEKYKNFSRMAETVEAA